MQEVKELAESIIYNAQLNALRTHSRSNKCLIGIVFWLAVLTGLEFWSIVGKEGNHLVNDRGIERSALNQNTIKNRD